MALLGNAGLLVCGLRLPLGCLGLAVRRPCPPNSEAESDDGDKEKSNVAEDLAARCAGVPLLPVGPREDGKVLRHDRGDYHEHDESRDDETHARQFAPARAIVQLSRQAAKAMAESFDC